MVSSMASEVNVLRSRYKQLKEKRDALRESDNTRDLYDEVGEDQSHQKPEQETRSVTPVKTPGLQYQDSVELYRQDSQVSNYIQNQIVIHTGCPKKTLFLGFLAISPLWKELEIKNFPN